jgi:DNA-binding MarR family transcriptional regulator
MRLSRRLRTTPAGAGLTPTQISVLFTVAREQHVRQSALAELEDLNPTLLSRTLAALSEGGLVRREADAEDRRGVVVHITPAGERRRRTIRRERAELLEAHLSRLDEPQTAALVRALPVLETLADSLREERP